MRVQTLPTGVLDVIRQVPVVYRSLRAFRWGIGNLLDARSVPGVRGRVHFNDFMLASTAPKDVARYTEGAESFVGILDHAMELSGRQLSDAQRILEIGCGYGRIVRELLRKTASDRVFVCDIIEDASDFCAAEFGVQKIHPDDWGTKMRESFDLVYLLSVFTHLDEQTIAQLWHRIVLSLRPGGVVVLTLHGPYSAAYQMEIYGKHWVKQQPAIQNALRNGGYYFQKYSYYSENYGMTWLTYERFMDLLKKAGPAESAMTQLSYGEAALDGHQDVYVFQKQGRATDAVPQSALTH